MTDSTQVVSNEMEDSTPYDAKSVAVMRSSFANEKGGPAACGLGMEDDCTLFEIVSATHLRKALGLTDGDRVLLEYDRSDIKFYPVTRTA